LTSVLIVGHEPLTERMTGPTIRNWELARVLARDSTVTLSVPGRPLVESPDFRLAGWDAAPPQELVATHDVVLASGYLLERHPGIAEARHLVIDLYDPFPLENLHMHESAGAEERYRIAAHDRAVQARSLRAGDVFLCASERQRDFWLGWLAAAGRVNPYVHGADPGLHRMLKVVPFGVPDEPPVARERRFRGVVPGIAEEDLVVIWGGGIWNWFDPLTLINAADRTREQLPRLRVLFPASASPSPEVLPMRMAKDARDLSDRLGMTGSRVFFGSSWIPYEQRGSVLLEADIGVSLHQESVETRLSFRTRILDYLWAGLPIIATEGDSMADLIDAEDLGLVVKAADVDSVVAALIELGTDSKRRQECSRRAKSAATRYQWPVVARPLADYCKAPYQAPDRAIVRQESTTTAWDGRLPENTEARRVLGRAATVLRTEGPAGLIRKGSEYLRGRRKRGAPL
jgi:glycosyltransferase involved in cell wall biosynthesis